MADKNRIENAREQGVDTPGDERADGQQDEDGGDGAKSFGSGWPVGARRSKFVERGGDRIRHDTYIIGLFAIQNFGHSNRAFLKMNRGRVWLPFPLSP